MVKPKLEAQIFSIKSQIIYLILNQIALMAKFLSQHGQRLVAWTVQIPTPRWCLGRSHRRKEVVRNLSTTRSLNIYRRTWKFKACRMKLLGLNRASKTTHGCPLCLRVRNRISHKPSRIALISILEKTKKRSSTESTSSLTHQMIWKTNLQNLGLELRSQRRGISAYLDNGVEPWFWNC